MNNQDIFHQIVEKSPSLALATSVEGHPNVRLMGFAYSKKYKKIFFVTFLQSPKVAEFDANHNVAFATVPWDQRQFNFRGKGIIKKSSHTISDVLDEFKQKNPNIEKMVETNKSELILYEIQFSKVFLTTDSSEVITYKI